jgi:hypothetical protein
MVNAVLDQLGRDLRGDELGSKLVAGK